MAFGPLLPIIGAGLLVVGAMLFWAAVQNWLADLIDRLKASLGPVATTLQNALVILDRGIVSGQRVFFATARVFYRETAESEVMTREEMKTIRREDLPVEVREKLESGETLQYEMSVGSVTNKTNKASSTNNDPTTYRLVVRRPEQKQE